jgi:peptide deformylase
MSILKIITAPHPLLREKSTPVDFKNTESKELKKLAADMIKTMLATDGAGLAAPQVGKDIRLAVINAKDGAFCIINPKIIRKSWAREVGQEGCLSVPGIFGQVKRAKKITLIYYNDSAKKIKTTVQGLMARVIQHEIDHLDGVLFIDRAVKIGKIEKNNNQS